MRASLTLKDVSERVDYGVTTSAVLDGVGPRFLRITDIDGTFVDWSSVPRCEISRTDASRYRLETGDLVVARTGASTGRSQWVQVDEPAVFASYLVRFRVRSNYDSRFIGYVLESSAWHDHVASVAHGKSAQPNMSASEMARFQFGCPDLSEQRAIAEVLGALDDKIAANTKLIVLLDTHMSIEYAAATLSEAIAVKVGDVANFLNRRRVPLSSRERDDRPGKVPYYGASGVFGSVDEAIFNEPLVLVGEDGSVIKEDGTPVIQYVWGPSWVNNHAHVLTGIGISTELLFLAIRQEQVTSLVTGAVQPKINMGNLKRLELRIPASESLKYLEAIVGAETASKRGVFEENRTLAATRDALLPQLVSGALRVKDAEKAIEEVL